MASLRILHASDLHISEFENIRSPLDHFTDIRDPSSSSLAQAARIIRTLPELTSQVRRRLASSYNSEPLLALSEFIYRNARHTVAGPNDEIEANGDKLDAVILTGDIATTGEIEDIQQAALFLRAKHDLRVPYRAAEAEYREATLSAIRIPIIVLPGNHDRYQETLDWKGQLPVVFYPGGRNFDDLIFQLQ